MTGVPEMIVQTAAGKIGEESLFPVGREHEHYVPGPGQDGRFANTEDSPVDAITGANESERLPL